MSLRGWCFCTSPAAHLCLLQTQMLVMDRVSFASELAVSGCLQAISGEQQPQPPATQRDTLSAAAVDQQHAVRVCSRNGVPSRCALPMY
jgi:hypothetical protein